MTTHFGSGRAWQEKVTNQWVETITSKFVDRKQVFIEGQVDATFVHADFKQYGVLQYKIFRVHCRNDERHRRLRNASNKSHLINI